MGDSKPWESGGELKLENAIQRVILSNRRMRQRERLVTGIFVNVTAIAALLPLHFIFQPLGGETSIRSRLFILVKTVVVVTLGYFYYLRGKDATTKTLYPKLATDCRFKALLSGDPVLVGPDNTSLKRVVYFDARRMDYQPLAVLLLQEKDLEKRKALVAEAAKGLCVGYKSMYSSDLIKGEKFLSCCWLLHQMHPEFFSQFSISVPDADSSTQQRDSEEHFFARELYRYARNYKDPRALLLVNKMCQGKEKCKILSGVEERMKSLPYMLLIESPLCNPLDLYTDRDADLHKWVIRSLLGDENWDEDLGTITQSQWQEMFKEFGLDEQEANDLCYEFGYGTDGL
ncbi:hypothetical protein K0U07_02555 [bacterium]|nr:hypothetical protein [bacterium]